MARGSDVDENGNPIDPDDPTNPNPGGTPPPSGGANPGQPNQPTTKGLEYWFGQGFSAEDIFDYETGQLKKGWTRTADGYDHDGTVTPGSWKTNTSTTPPPTPKGTMPTDPFIAPPERWDRGAWDAGAPTFTPPAYEKPPAFVDPDYGAALKDPAYQFEASEGNRALMQSAAARGVLNGGGTLKDILQWGSNFATTRVNDVRNRARDSYQLNYQTQYADPYKYAYQSALDAFTGSLNEWQTKGQVGQRQNELDWNHKYTPWNDTWNRRVTVGMN